MNPWQLCRAVAQLFVLTLTFTVKKWRQGSRGWFKAADVYTRAHWQKQRFDPTWPLWPFVHYITLTLYLESYDLCSAYDSFLFQSIDAKHREKTFDSQRGEGAHTHFGYISDVHQIVSLHVKWFDSSSPWHFQTVCLCLEIYLSNMWATGSSLFRRRELILSPPELWDLLQGLDPELRTSQWGALLVEGLLSGSRSACLASPAQTVEEARLLEGVTVWIQSRKMEEEMKQAVKKMLLQ